MLLTRLAKDLSIGNLTNVTYRQAIVVASIVAEILVNVGEKIVLKWKDFYRRRKNSPFLPCLVYVLCKREEVLFDDTNYEVESCRTFNYIVVMKKTCRALKSQKIDNEGSNGAVVNLEEDEDADMEPTSAYSQSLLSRTCLEANIG
uniref:Uncharacterized protein n=1 Tax=Solanum lycopersicum TaxID=4081 RepID=A0A3Q7EE81_SOLLC